jgi:hypothetical protein
MSLPIDCPAKSYAVTSETILSNLIASWRPTWFLANRSRLAALPFFLSSGAYPRGNNTGKSPGRKQPILFVVRGNSFQFRINEFRRSLKEIIPPTGKG